MNIKEILENHKKWLHGEGGCRVNLRGAVLWGCNGNRKQIKSLFMFEKYAVAYTSEHLQIGCENHRISEWWEFDDERIARMDEGALDWWKENKEFIRSIIEKYPAVPTWVKDRY